MVFCAIPCASLDTVLFANLGVSCCELLCLRSWTSSCPKNRVKCCISICQSMAAARKAYAVRIEGFAESGLMQFTGSPSHHNRRALSRVPSVNWDGLVPGDCCQNLKHSSIVQNRISFQFAAPFPSHMILLSSLSPKSTSVKWDSSNLHSRIPVNAAQCTSLPLSILASRVQASDPEHHSGIQNKSSHQGQRNV
jgi:hypothetical protein